MHAAARPSRPVARLILPPRGCYRRAMNSAALPPRRVFRPVPEWAHHRAVWLAWPWDASEWGDQLAGAQEAVVRFVDALLGAGEAVEMLVPPEAPEDFAPTTRPEARVDRAPAPGELRLHRTPYGDSWTRDTGPFFVRGADGLPAALAAIWNGWGEKYLMPGDERVATWIARAAGCDPHPLPFILEGGSVDFDGAGCVLTTRECVLNPNRNAGWTEESAEAVLRATFGVERVVWISEGLHFDHTDGHIDNIARFVAPGQVVAMRPGGPDDPHADRLAAIAETLTAAFGEANVHLIPSPGFVPHPESGEALPASYLNFLIARDAVIVPVYGTAHDGPACEALARLFPGRRVHPIRCNALLTGGGSLHCISKEEPAP
jgi:agmatine deiminase